MEKSTVVKSNKPYTIEEMAAYGNIDQSQYELIGILHNIRPITSRKKGYAETVEMRQTKANRKPKYGSLVPERTVEILTALLAENGLQGPPIERREAQKEVSGDKLGGILFSDLHFDRLNVEGTTITKRMKDATEHYKRAVDRVIMFDPSALLIGNLGDTMNTDGRYTTTSGKHPQQNNTTEKDAFKRIFEWSIDMLHYMKQFNIPVEYASVSGNHDENAAYMMGIGLQAYFSNTKITVEPNRFYKERGKILIMLSHGQNETPRRVLEIAVNEFVRKKYNQMYSYMGHKHIKEMQQVGPMVNKRVGALVPPSEWEAKFGYRPYKGMSGFVWSKESGEIADLKG